MLTNFIKIIITLTFFLASCSNHELNTYKKDSNLNNDTDKENLDSQQGNNKYSIKINNKNITIDIGKSKCSKIDYTVTPADTEIVWTSTDRKLYVNNNQVCYTNENINEESVKINLYGSILTDKSNDNESNSTRIYDVAEVKIIKSKNNNDHVTPKPTDPNINDNTDNTPDNNNHTKPDINVDFDKNPNRDNLINIIKSYNSYSFFRDNPKPYVNFNIIDERIYIVPENVKSVTGYNLENYFSKTLFLNNNKGNMEENNIQWYFVLYVPTYEIFAINEENEFIKLEKAEKNGVKIIAKNNKILNECIQFCEGEEFKNKHKEIVGSIVGIVDNKYIHRKEVRVLNKGQYEELARILITNNVVKKDMKDMIPLKDVDKVFHVNQYVVDKITYDDKYTHKYEDYFTFIDGKAVCDGYASMYYRMANELGVRTRKHIGDAPGGYHAWNSVVLNKKYYYVDPTWADNVGVGSLSFFMIPEKIFDMSHERNDTFEYRFGTEYLFYGHKLFNLYFDKESDYHRIISNINKLPNYDKNKHTVEFIVPSSKNIEDVKSETGNTNLYQYWYKDLKQNYPYIFSLINISNGNIYYTGNVLGEFEDKLVKKITVTFKGKHKDVNLKSSELKVKESEATFSCETTEDLICTIVFEKPIIIATVEFKKEGFYANTSKGNNVIVIKDNGKDIFPNDTYLAMDKVEFKENQPVDKIFALKKDLDKFNPTCNDWNKNKISFVGKDSNSGLLSVNDDNIEYNSGSGEWISIPNGQEVEVNNFFFKSHSLYEPNGNKPYVLLLRKTNDGKVCSEYYKIEIFNRKASPSWVNSDSHGNLMNVNNNMEIKEENSNKWISVGSTGYEINENNTIKLPEGKYSVRFKGTENTFASTSVSVDVKYK